MNKTFSIKTLGCKFNQYESSLIANHLIEMGWIAKPFGEQVDFVIVNTCSVTDKSEKKCRNYIRQGAHFSKYGKAIVTGCMAEIKREALKNMPEVLDVFRNEEKKNIYKELNKIICVYEGNDLHIDENIKITAPGTLFRTRAYVNIQNGCDGNCSYCIVPTVRGKPVSRNFHNIIDHAKGLIDKGYPEIILTGITIGKYNYNDKDIADLVNSLINIEGNFRLRITSIEPKHVTEKLLDTFTSNKVCNHIHLPLQSGSPDILRMMNRPYTLDEYKSVIDKIKNKNSEIAIGTDIIIGFPGEDEKAFMDSMNIIEWSGFAYVHQFTFSKRSGTPAALIKQNSSSKEISERVNRMRNLSSSIALKYKQNFENRILISVLERKKDNTGFIAVTDNYLKIDIDNLAHNDSFSKKLHNVKLLKAGKLKNIGILI